MSVRYEIDKEHRLILTVGEASVTASEIKSHQERLLRDPDFDASFNQLIDVTTATGLDMSTDEAREVAVRPIVSPMSRRAFVASRPPIYGLGRLMEMYHEHAEVQVFYDRDEALRWLGISEASGLY